MKTNGEHGAFAAYSINESCDGREQDGLTKREYFAAMAMQGILSSGAIDRNYEEGQIAKIALLNADALIDELNKSK